MKITVEKVVRAGLEPVWDAWNNPAELQRQGWRAILDNFGRYVEAKAG